MGRQTDWTDTEGGGGGGGRGEGRRGRNRHFIHTEMGETDRLNRHKQREMAERKRGGGRDSVGVGQRDRQ